MSLLGTSITGRQKVQEDIVKAGPVISADQYQNLLLPYTSAKIKAAMFSINGDKALSPDGFGAHFYKDNWDIVGSVVTEAILDFFHN